LIKGESDLAPHLVGGDSSPDPPDQPTVLHDIYRMDCRRDNGPTYLGVALRLFAMVRMPRYHVIVGRRLKEAPPAEKRAPALEGFSLTPEFPEIEEAQRLLGWLGS
jgi:hypothetical protein